MNSCEPPLTELFTRSRLMILDFSEIPASASEVENIQKYFEACTSHGVNPRSAKNRQAFNDRMLKASRARYLVSRYAEDRSAMLAGSQIAAEGRTLHLGIDIFMSDLEPVFAPCDGTIVRTGYEPGPHSFGHYLFLKPAAASSPYIFFGHLSKELPRIGRATQGQQIARIGDYHGDENGGWSRHLHLQLFTRLPKPDELLIGYTSKSGLPAALRQYPDPLTLFPNWRLDSH